MKLFQSIDGLLVGTKYLSWIIALTCIPVSAVLLFANLSLGLASVMVCAAALLLAVGVTLLFLPEKLARGGKSRNIIAIVAMVLAATIIGITYFSVSGFPELNLLFI